MELNSKNQPSNFSGAFCQNLWRFTQLLTNLMEIMNLHKQINDIVIIIDDDDDDLIGTNFPYLPKVGLNTKTSLKRSLQRFFDCF